MKTTAETSELRPLGRLTFPFAFGRVPTLFLAVAMLTAVGIGTTARADRVGHDVAAGYVIVDQIPGWPRDVNDVDDNTNALCTLRMAVNDFRLHQSATASGWNRGDFQVQIGDDNLDDTANGVLISAVAQNQRNNYGTNAMETSGVAPYADGHWEVVTWNCPMVSSQTANQGEANVNFSAAYFPFSTWFGGVAVNAGNGAILDNFWGSPGLVLGTHFIDAKTTNGPNGTAYLDLRPFGIDSRRDGVLLVNSAKNEANYALSRAETNGTWTIWSHDNRNDGRNYEQDPLCFVFVPRTNTAVVSGKIMGDGAITNYSGASPQFTVTKNLTNPSYLTNSYNLKVTGGSATNGVLIISAEGGEANNGDNIVTYQPLPGGDGWNIQSRDIPGLANPQNIPASEPVFSFVYIPVESPGATVRPTSGLVTYEDGRSAQFTIKISGSPQPTADVTVTLSSSNPNEGTNSPTTITFTPNDWNLPQTVTVTGVDDAVADGPQLYTINLSALSSTDPNYNGFVPASVSVLNNDDETGISFSVASVTTTEAGGTATYTAVLNSAPTADVTLNLSSSDTTEATVSPSSLTFTPADWNVPQTITVTGVDDPMVDGNVAFTILGTLSSADPLYNGSVANMSGINLDNDVAGIVIPPDHLSISESNSTATFTVVLTSQPTDYVTVNCVSSDTTEGTVTPSVTFTPANWNVPQTVTVTALDDFIPDGPITFTISNTVTSEDLLYAAIDPSDVTVTTLDNEPVLALPFGDITYGLGEPPRTLDGWATITDPDTATYNGGSNVVTITAGATSNDRLSVRNIGTGTGQVSVSGSTVSFEGNPIGTVSGGVGATALKISFNTAGATPVAAQAVLRAIAYNNVDANAPPSTRTLSVALWDGAGGSATPVTKSITLRQLRVYDFQQGLDIGFGPYIWAGDDNIHPDFPDTAYPTGYSVGAGMWIDWVNASLLGQPQVLLKFTNVFGGGSGQIPATAKIVSAELILHITDSGNGMRLNRMLGDWDPDTANYNTFGGDGISLDDVEAISATNAFLCDPANSANVAVGYTSIGVSRDVQAWFDGTNNYGWVMSPWPRTSNGNGTGFSPSEAANIADRPRLRVQWLPAGTSVATFRQGEGSYTDAVDTQVRQSTPDADYSTAATLAPDAAVGTAPDPQQVLIRFDNLIGSGAGQVPAGSMIDAAVLELTSISSESQGDGGQFYSLLKSWNATDTWNIWGSGVSADGVEAATTATTSIGPSDTSQTPLQSTMHTVDLTSDVQAWASNLRPNYGWVIMPWTGGNDGWGISSSDNTSVEFRPQLRVYYEQGALLLTIVHNGSNVQLTFSGKVGRTYSIRRVSALGGSWSSSIGTATVGGGGTASFTDNSPLPNTAFYRISYP